MTEPHEVLDIGRRVCRERDCAAIPPPGTYRCAEHLLKRLALLSKKDRT
jgi:hypothetical protein